MIQRIQSVLLFFIAILLGSLLLLPIWQNIDQSNNNKAHLNAFSLTFTEAMVKSGTDKSPSNEKSTIYIAVIAVLAAASALYSIFQYKNRMLQLKLGMLNSFLISLLLGGFFWAIKNGNTALADPGKGEFLAGFYIPMIAILLNFFANRFIKKDETLVRSVDRLR